MSNLDLERENLQKFQSVALRIQIAAAGVATSFILILIPNIETISFTAFFLGYTFKKEFSFSTTLIMAITWEILATMIFGTSGIIFPFKLLAWIIITLLGTFARFTSTQSSYLFALFGLLSALIYDILVTIADAILLSLNSPNETFLPIFTSRLVIGIYFTLFHILGNGFLFSFLPLVYSNTSDLLVNNFSHVMHPSINIKTTKYKLLVPLIIVLLISGIVYTSYNEDTQPPTAEPVTIELNISYNELLANFSMSIDTYSNYSVFDVLNSSTNLAYRYYGPAVYVYGINNIFENVNITGNFWIYYINDIRASIACNDYYLSNGDIIFWNYE